MSLSTLPRCPPRHLPVSLAVRWLHCFAMQPSPPAALLSWFSSVCLTLGKPFHLSGLVLILWNNETGQSDLLGLLRDADSLCFYNVYLTQAVGPCSSSIYSVQATSVLASLSGLRGITKWPSRASLLPQACWIADSVVIDGVLVALHFLSPLIEAQQMQV